jgi:hypothetical protein
LLQTKERSWFLILKNSLHLTAHNDFAHDLSENSDGIVGADEEWHDGRGEDRATVHHFTGPDPGLIRVVAHDINAASSSFDFFRLMFTEELFNSALLRQRRTATISSTLKKRRSKQCKEILLFMRYIVSNTQ